MASIISNIYIASNKVVGIILQFNNIIEGQKVFTLHFDATIVWPGQAIRVE